MNLLTDCNAKINEIESKTPSITSWATNAAFNVKIKYRISDLFKKKKNRLWYQILEIEGKYFITSDCNKFTSEIIDTKIKQKELVNKFDI